MKKNSAPLIGKSSVEQRKTPEGRSIKILDLLGYIGSVVLIIYTASRWGTHFDPYLQNDDTRIAIFPFWAFHEDLFKGDYIAQVMGIFSPWLHKTSYYFLTFAFDLLTATKVVHILTISWCAFHVFRIGHRRAGALGGLFSLYLMLHAFVILQRSAGGLPRAFAMPLIFMTVDGIDRSSEKQSILGTVLGFGIYPTAGLISLTIYSIWSVAKCITSDYNRIDVRKVLLKLTLVVLLCALFLAPSLMSNKAFGSILLAQQARLMPEAGEGGRYKLVPLPEISTVIKENFTILTQTSGDSPLPFLKLLTQKSHGAPLYIIMCIALLFSLMGIMRPPYMALTIALTGIVLFFVACFLAFRLFLPERMIMYTLPVAVIYLLSTTFTGIRHTISEGVLRRVSSIVLLLVFIVFFGIAFKGPIGLNVNTHSQEGLFRILKTLPEPALFAGHPKRMNNIPLWAQRAVLVNLETSQIFYDKAWNEIKERTYDNFNAYYASSPEPVKVLREKYGVDYMLIHEQDVSPFYTKGCDYFEPFTTWVRRLCQKPSKDLIWKKAAPSSIVGQASRFKVINLEIFLKQF